MLVVGVVAANFGAAGAAEQGGGDVLRRGEGVHQGLDHAAGPVPGPVQAVLGAVQGVQGGQGLVVAAGPQGVQQILAGIQRGHLFLKIQARAGGAVRRRKK